MVEMNMIQALNSALDIQLKNDDSVIIFGEDVGFFGGVFLKIFVTFYIIIEVLNKVGIFSRVLL